MSRYDVPTTMFQTTCTVGWDNPMQTFFAQVESVPADPDQDPEILLWIGDRVSACLDVAELAEAVAPWATLPPAIVARLEDERDTAPPPTRLQADNLNLIR